MRGAAALAMALLTTGCLVGPNHQRPPYPVPAEFRAAPAGGQADPSLGDVEWWTVFRDEALVALIRTALAENFDLRIAVARILDARSQVVVARSFLFPTIGAGIGASYSRFAGSSGQFDPTLSQLNQSFHGTGGIEASYEIDLWGRLRRATEAAGAQLLASEWARRVVVSALVTEVARAYFELRGLDDQLEIARQSLASREDSLRLVRLRLDGGVATLLDVRQAEILSEQAAQTIPVLLRQIEQAENLISALLGRNPGPVPRGQPLEQQLALPPLPPGLTSELVERRPDIRQAEEQLVAANAQIGIARAQFFPQVALTGSAGVGGNAFNSALFGPFGFFTIMPAISMPLYTAGRVQAGVDSAEARTQEAVLRYQQTVLQAFREVADTLIAYERNREFRLEKQRLVEVTRDALRLSEIRYRGGVASYLEVLDSDTRRFDAELDLVRANFDERLAVVQLYRALGGGWRPADVTEPPARSDTGAPVAPVARRSPGEPRDR